MRKPDWDAFKFLNHLVIHPPTSFPACAALCAVNSVTGRFWANKKSEQIKNQWFALEINLGEIWFTAPLHSISPSLAQEEKSAQSWNTSTWHCHWKDCWNCIWICHSARFAQRTIFSHIFQNIIKTDCNVSVWHWKNYEYCLMFPTLTAPLKQEIMTCSYLISQWELSFVV